MRNVRRRLIYLLSAALVPGFLWLLLIAGTVRGASGTVWPADRISVARPTITGTVPSPTIVTVTVTATLPSPTPTGTREIHHAHLPVVRNGGIPLPPPLPPPVPASGTHPVDFEGIREALQEDGQDLSFVKVGFHTGYAGNTDGLDNWMEELDAAGVPFFLKSVDDPQHLIQAQELARSSGVSHTLVYRQTGPEYDVPDYNLPPEQAALLHWERHKAVFPDELDPELVWIETINEVDKNRAEWLGQFALETARLALADGYRWAAFGWASGEPEAEHWQTPSMLEFLRLAAQHPDRLAIALHEYSYERNDVGNAYPFLIGRFQFLFQICDAYRIPRPTVLITEWGWEYRNVPTVDQAIADIRWASWLYAAYPEVRGAAIWYLGYGYGGIADQAQLLIEPMRDYSRTNYFIIEQGWGAVDPGLFAP